MKIGETQRMKESYHERVANYMSPESCLDGPRGRGEAFDPAVAGLRFTQQSRESAGVVLSSENTSFRRPSRWTVAKATRLTALCESLNAPAESKTHACVDVFHAGIGIPRKGALR